MACPSCSGTQREPIAPGYWRCTSQVAHTTVVGVPVDPADPRSEMRPLEQVSHSPCGYAYQERDGRMASAQLCRCGMFAIGSCSQCGTFTCGVHGRLAGERFLCSEHAAAAEHARQEQQRSEARAQAAAVRSAAEAARPKSVLDHIQVISAAADARQAGRASSAQRAAAETRQRAQQLLPELVALIHEVLAMPGAKSVTYEVAGERRHHKWGTAHAPDPSGLGTHVADKVTAGPKYAKPYPRFGPVSTYTGVWPAMAWLSGWTEERWNTGPSEPLISVLWFNRSGMLAGGFLDAPGRGAALPFTSPLPLSAVTVDHLATICRSVGSKSGGSSMRAPASVGPNLLRKRLAQIVTGQRADPSQGGAHDYVGYYRWDLER